MFTFNNTDKTKTLQTLDTPNISIELLIKWGGIRNVQLTEENNTITPCQ